MHPPDLASLFAGDFSLPALPAGPQRLALPSGPLIRLDDGTRIPLVRADIDGEQYAQTSIRNRLRALFLAHVGEVLTNDQLEQVATNPQTGKVPKRWHQRVSELRTHEGYTIWTGLNRRELRSDEYLMPTSAQRDVDRRGRRRAGERVKPTARCWQELLERSGGACEWDDDGTLCGVVDGQPHPDGGTAALEADHMRPHHADAACDPDDAAAWRVLCRHHQMRKRHYIDSTTGRIDVLAVLRDASEATKKDAWQYLSAYFDGA